MWNAGYLRWLMQVIGSAMARLFVVFVLGAKPGVR